MRKPNAEYMKRYRERHPERIVEIRTKFYDNNKERESIRHKKNVTDLWAFCCKF
jgi:uncharacterized short protein YbdD (DUF466 family)